MIAYHVVTDRPMTIGQEIIFDKNHHSGVFHRVQAKLHMVRQIYANPAAYKAEELEHHTAVALRELAMEEVRQQKYPHYPSRMNCLYVSETLEEAEKWGAFFAELGRPTYSIVKLNIEGRCFTGDATKCFHGQTDYLENLRLADIYWRNESVGSTKPPVKELLVDGKITVLEVVKEINANLK